MLKAVFFRIIFLFVVAGCSTGIGSHRAFSDLRWEDATSCDQADIVETKIRKIKDPVFAFGQVQYHRIGTAVGPVYEFSEGASLQYEGKNYRVKLLRVTSPSEHRVLGLSFLLELQFFSISEAGEPLALGIFVRKGQDRPALRTLFTEKRGELSLSELVPPYGGHYAYTGSLPVSPCYSVPWLVMKSAIEASAEDVDEYLSRWDRGERIPARVENIEETEQ